MYSYWIGSFKRAWNLGSLSRSNPRRKDAVAAAISPTRHAGIETANTWGMVMSNPFSFDMVTNATTAAAIGEQVIPTCEATDATPQGRSGRIPFFNAMSQIIGIKVYTT